MPAPHLLISRQEDIHEALLEEFVATLNALFIPFETEQRERTVHASLEYYIPTALVVFLAKPFFDGFLKKAGEDAYAAFKRAFAALVSKASSIAIRVVRSAPAKIADVSPYSRVISIYAHTASGIRLKFLLPATTTEAEALIVLDSLLSLLQDHYSSPGTDTLSVILSTSKTRFLRVLHYDAATNTWSLLALSPTA